MKHRATPNFWQHFERLPANVQQLAHTAFALMKQDPKHPSSIHLKKIGRFWSAGVGIHHRALAVEHDGNLAWFGIGTHAEYNSLIKR